MATVEIEEADVEVGRKAIALLQELSTGDTRRDFMKALKKIRPDVRTDDDVAQEIAAPYVEQIKALEEKIGSVSSSIDEDKKAREERDQDMALEAQFDELRKRGFTDEGLNKVKAIMVDHKVPSALIAASYYESQNPPPKAEAAAWEPQSLGIRDQTVANDVEGLWKNEELWADRAVSETLADIRKTA